MARRPRRPRDGVAAPFSPRRRRAGGAGRGGAPAPPARRADPGSGTGPPQGCQTRRASDRIKCISIVHFNQIRVSSEFITIMSEFCENSYQNFGILEGTHERSVDAIIFSLRSVDMRNSYRSKGGELSRTMSFHKNRCNVRCPLL